MWDMRSIMWLVIICTVFNILLIRMRSGSLAEGLVYGGSAGAIVIGLVWLGFKIREMLIGSKVSDPDDDKQQPPPD